jgi:enoyl-CoA hydratase
MREFEFLQVESSDSVVVVTLDSPPVNAVSEPMFEEIRDFFTYFDELLPEAKVVVITGRGRHFCAGNDLGEFATLDQANAPGRLKLVREAFTAVYDCPVPLIAAVRGMAAGSGVAIAASADILVCGESAKLAAPEVSVGMLGGARHLRRLVPEQVMRAMYFTSRSVSAARLVEYGGINEVVPDEELLDAALALAREIAGHSRAALRGAKQSLNAAEFTTLKAGYESEQHYITHLAGHPDSLEARLAVLDRRPPRFADS